MLPLTRYRTMLDDNITILTASIHGAITLIGIAALIASIKLLPRRMPEELFLVSLVVIHGLVPFLVGPGKLHDSSPWVHFEASIAALYTVLGFVFTRELLRAFMLCDIANNRQQAKTRTNSTVITIVLFVIGIIAFTIAIYSTRGELQLGAERLAGRDQNSFYVSHSCEYRLFGIDCTVAFRASRKLHRGRDILGYVISLLHFGFPRHSAICCIRGWIACFWLHFAGIELEACQRRADEHRRCDGIRSCSSLSSTKIY